MANNNLHGVAEIESYLTGIDFPASKDEIISTTKEHDAPADVIGTLEQIPNRDYNSQNELMNEVGERI